MFEPELVDPEPELPQCSLIALSQESKKQTAGHAADATADTTTRTATPTRSPSRARTPKKKSPAVVPAATPTNEKGKSSPAVAFSGSAKKLKAAAGLASPPPVANAAATKAAASNAVSDDDDDFESDGDAADNGGGENDSDSEYEVPDNNGDDESEDDEESAAVESDSDDDFNSSPSPKKRRKLVPKPKQQKRASTSLAASAPSLKLLSKATLPVPAARRGPAHVLVAAASASTLATSNDNTVAEPELGPERATAGLPVASTVPPKVVLTKTPNLAPARQLKPQLLGAAGGSSGKRALVPIKNIPQPAGAAAKVSVTAIVLSPGLAKRKSDFAGGASKRRSGPLGGVRIVGGPSGGKPTINTFLLVFAPTHVRPSFLVVVLVGSIP
jgi:hypothetical protein